MQRGTRAIVRRFGGFLLGVAGVVGVTGVAGVVLATAGCASIAGMSERYGDTGTVVPAMGDEVAEVAEQVMREYGFADVAASSTRLDGVVTGTNALGELVAVVIEPAGARTTRVTVSNAAGKAVAEAVLRAIERELEARDSAGRGEVGFRPRPVAPAPTPAAEPASFPREPRPLEPQSAQSRNVEFDRESELEALERALGM